VLIINSLLLLETELDTTSVEFGANFFFVKNTWFTSCITVVALLNSYELQKDVRCALKNGSSMPTYYMLNKPESSAVPWITAWRWPLAAALWSWWQISTDGR